MFRGGGYVVVMPKVHHAAGPFKVDQLRGKDPYELSDGHAIEVMPTGSRGSRRVAAAAAAIGSDPAVSEIGAETGHALSGNTLRAPDLSVGRVPDQPGWVSGAPPLAVEYADRGQPEEELKAKISDLLPAGTQQIWVVRLTGQPRVEVHAPGLATATLRPGDSLHAPGILANPFPVSALFDVDAAQAVALRNLLQRQGYADLDAVRGEGHATGRMKGRKEGRKEGRVTGRKEGRAQGLRDALFKVLAARSLEISEVSAARIAAESDPKVLTEWLGRAATASTADEVLR